MCTLRGLWILKLWLCKILQAVLVDCMYRNLVCAVFELLNNTESYLVLLPGWNALPYNNIRDESKGVILLKNNMSRQLMTRYYCQTQKTVNIWKISGMLIVYWPITIKFRICKQTSKPQNNYHCCLRFSYLVPYWLISRNTTTLHKYFWYSRFCEFHRKL